PTRPQPMITTYTIAPFARGRLLCYDRTRGRGRAYAAHDHSRPGAPVGLACIPVPTLGEVAKRVLLGRRLATERLQQALLPKRVALPVYSSDALSSVAYATQELIVLLTLGG